MTTTRSSRSTTAKKISLRVCRLNLRKKMYFFRKPLATPKQKIDATHRHCYHENAGWSSLVARWAHNPKVGGSNPPPATILPVVRSGDIGNRMFRRHRLHFWPEGVLQGLQGFFLQINIAQIVIHKTDQPDSVVDFLNADGLAGEGDAEVDFLVVEANASAMWWGI